MTDYVEVLRTAFVELWASVIAFLPQLLFAIAVFLLGLLFAHILRMAVIRVVNVLKIDDLMTKLEVTSLFAKGGITLRVGEFLGWIVKWFIIVMALIATADILQWYQVNAFLQQVAMYLPNVLIAVVILLVGTLLGSVVQNVIRGAVTATGMKGVEFLAGVAKWAIIVFSFMAALVQLGIAQALIQILFTGFVAMIALAGGLAFGLGGRQHASRVLDRLSEDLTNKQ